mmetsp:Transcript_106795/g.341055  ORF Transcript_106795/g.341055 Transcript_106795/m.341055 type:complete len:173 (-) Transcript_106795:99-617(-)
MEAPNGLGCCNFDLGAREDPDEEEPIDDESELEPPPSLPLPAPTLSRGAFALPFAGPPPPPLELSWLPDLVWLPKPEPLLCWLSPPLLLFACRPEELCPAPPALADEAALPPPPLRPEELRTAALFALALAPAFAPALLALLAPLRLDPDSDISEATATDESGYLPYLAAQV